MRGEAGYGILSAYDEQPCALRAPTAISARIKGIRAEIVVLAKNQDGLG